MNIAMEYAKLAVELYFHGIALDEAIRISKEKMKGCALHERS